MAMIAPLAAAGFTARQIAAFEGATWAPVGYAAYRSYRNRASKKTSNPYITMPGAKRTYSNAGLANRSKTWVPKRGKRQSARMKLYRQPRDSYHTVKLTDVHEINQSALISSFTEQAAPNFLPYFEGLTRHSNYYQFVRLVSIGVKLVSNNPILVMSCTQLDDHTAPPTSQTKEFFEKQQNLRLHRVLPDNKIYGRSLNLQKEVGLFRDFTKCTNISTDFADATRECSIKFHCPSLPQDTKVYFIREYVAQFQGVQQDVSIPAGS